MRPSRRLAVVLVSATLMVVAACSPSTNSSTPTTTELVPKVGGAFTFGLAAEPSGFDPSTNPLTPSGWMVAKAVFEPLAAYDNDGKPVPYLAKAFDHNADYTQWTIRLRDGVMFSDGTPCDAEAVRFNLEDRRKGLLTGQAMARVAKVEATDSKTVVVTMDEPWAHFPELMTNQPGFMAAPASIQPGDARTVASNPVGTGPFLFRQWDRGNQILMPRNPKYWQKDAAGRQLPYVEQVTFKVVTDPSTRISGLSNGDLDAWHSPDPAISTRFLNGDYPDLHYNVDKDGGDELFMTLNTQKGPFTNKNLRIAAAEAIDRDALNKQLYSGQMTVANGPFAHDSQWGDTANFPRPNLEHAKQLVREANGGQPVPVTFTIIESAENDALGQAIAAQLDAAGFKVALDIQPETAFAVKVVTASSDATMFTFWYNQDPDGSWHHYTSRSSPPVGQVGLNFARYSSPTVDKAIDAAGAITDTNERKRLYQQVWDEQGNEIPYLYLFHTPQTVAWGANVHGVDKYTLPDGQQARAIIWGNMFLDQAWVNR